MPRILPNGLDVRVMPQAPNIGDPKDFAVDITQGLAAAHAGLTLGQELARIQDTGKQIELERARRKAELAQLDFAEQMRQHELESAPARVTAAIATAQAQAAEASNQQILAQARAAQGLPSFQATLEGQNLQLGQQQTSNALAGAKADTSFSALSAPERAQTLAAAQVQGSWGVKPGQEGTAGTPLPFRKQDSVQEYDPQTGNTIETDVVRDSRTGAIISHGESRVLKPGVDEKSVTSSRKEATALVSTIAMADDLGKALDDYSAKGKGGVGQAMATAAANSASSGPMSVLKKALGASLQNAETVKVAGLVQNFKNTIANAMFGSALSKNESENLIGMLPTTDDLADPPRAREKLKTAKQFLETKLKPYKDSGVLGKLRIQASEGGNPTGISQTAGQPQEGTIKEITLRDGTKALARRVRGGWVPVK